MVFQKTLSVSNRGRGTREITDDVAAVVRESGVSTGLAHVFIQHTSASLIVTENADPTVRGDLERLAGRLVPDGDPLFEHDMEGPDDMPAHARSVLTHTSLTLPVGDGRLALGTWQGVFVWEHRRHAHTRSVVVTVSGE